MSAHWRRQAPPEVARLVGWLRGALGSLTLAGRRLSTTAHARRPAYGFAKGAFVVPAWRAGRADRRGVVVSRSLSPQAGAASGWHEVASGEREEGCAKLPLRRRHEDAASFTSCLDFAGVVIVELEG